MLQLIGRDGDLTIAALEDDIDFFTSDEVRAAGERLLDDGCRCLILDTSALTFIDSSGISVLLRLWQRLDDQNGTLVMAVPDDHLKWRLDILGLDSVIPITTTLHEAVTHARTLRALPQRHGEQRQAETA
ncbi:STAS domain-containing protein [Streptomyces longwoodensis]|uniref:STAS domain-containing protein n=1 Tax=Streptomyces longwoodensis TaxID=68231 RepID=UPI0033CBED91